MLALIDVKDNVSDTASESSRSSLDLEFFAPSTSQPSDAKSGLCKFITFFLGKLLVKWEAMQFLSVLYLSFLLFFYLNKYRHSAFGLKFIWFCFILSSWIVLCSWTLLCKCSDLSLWLSDSKAFHEDLLGLDILSSSSEIKKGEVPKAHKVPSTNMKKVWQHGGVTIPLSQGKRSELSATAKSVLEQLEDLTFMNSSVLMFPLKPE